ncbi:RING finger domain protein [Tricladium varicosporioides]|nr:RING finger domain protein [Hymenoscyphus varicosporioides]
MADPAATHAGWEWPEEIKPEPFWEEAPSEPEGSDEIKDEKRTPPLPEKTPGKEIPQGNTPRQSQAHYKPRQCRICLEEVLPSFEPEMDGIGAFFNPNPKVQYISSDPESGRLLRPCKCRGSQAYVHEGCLEAWRHSDRSYNARTYYECPTCKFKYRLERLKWSRFISSVLTQLLLTSVITFMIVFMLGFVADPIINLYFEPTTFIASIVESEDLAQREFTGLDLEYNGWTVHFLKGLTSVGVLGFLKVLLSVNPFAWFRTGGLLGGRNRRERNDSTAMFIIIVGVLTFMLGVWTWVRAWSKRTLEKAGERVLDVQGDDDEHEHEE